MTEHTYLFVSRPPTEAIPHGEGDPAFVRYESANYTMVHSVELPGGFKMLDFGRATFAGRVPPRSCYLLSMWPLDDRERAEFVLRREYGNGFGDYDWWLDDLRTCTDPELKNEIIESLPPSVRWAVKLILAEVES